MRLKEEKVDSLAKKILNELKSNPKVFFKSPEDKIVHTIKSIFINDLKREDELEEEIHKKLKENINKINRENLNYNDLFRKAKIKLAKEKKIIL